MDLEKAVAELGADVGSMRKEYLKVSGALARFGLSEYESRAYVALVALGSGSANLVAEVAQIPRTSAYKVMKSLEGKGFVEEKRGRPRLFTAVDAAELGKRLAADVEETFSRVRAVKDMLSEKGVPQLVYTITGRERVLDKIGEMLDRAEHSFVISSPSFPEIRRSLTKAFASAVARGVLVTVITSPFVKAPKDVKVIRRRALIATDVIGDGKTALIAAPDLSACGYTDNEALSKHLEDFLNIMAERGD